MYLSLKEGCVEIDNNKNKTTGWIDLKFGIVFLLPQEECDKSIRKKLYCY